MDADGSVLLAPVATALHECKVCLRTFKWRETLKLHARTHTGERPYECEVCARKFNAKAYLHTHLRVHTGERPFKCGECGDAFTQATALKMHSHTHSLVKPFACETCLKTFSAKAYLKMHSRVHTKERPYKCEACKCAFTQQQALTAHKRTHTGERPFRCGVCAHASASRANLKKHEQTHDKPTEWKCKYQDYSPAVYKGAGIECGAHFSGATSLNYHIKERHDKDHVFKLPAELAVRDALKKHFGAAMQHDWLNRLPLSCNDGGGGKSAFYRFDFRTPAPLGTEMVVITEVDEFQHRRYPCDLKRMLEAAQVLMLEFPSTPVVFIRWNPDPRTIGRVPFNVPFASRVETLMRVLQNEPALNGKRLSELIGKKNLNVVYMYYDLDADLTVRMLNEACGENSINALIVRESVVAVV